MKKAVSSILVFVTVLLFLPCCKKIANTNPTLPPAIQKGSNTMGARINGGIWVKQACISCIGGQTGLSATAYNDTFLIYGEAPNSSGGKTSVIFYLKGVTHTGDYMLAQEIPSSLTASFAQVGMSQQVNSLIYKTDDTHQGILTITRLDPSKHIISGVFSFDAINQKDINDTAYITEGRFDAVYQD